MSSIIAKTTLASTMLMVAITPAHAAKSCYSYDITKPYTGHVVRHKIGKTSGGKLNHIITVKVPPAQKAKLTPSFAKYYFPVPEFLEISSTPLDNSARPTYKFSFSLRVGRQNNKNLPKWAKPVKEQPFARCALYGDGTRLIISKRVYGKNPKCRFTVNAKTLPNVKGAKFIEARAYDYDNALMYRGRYSLHYPKQVAQSRITGGNTIRARLKAGQCKPT